jgi:hypothetical protein
MKDMAYSEKLSRYANENILALTLTESFFQNQPNWTKFKSEGGINCAPIPALDAAALQERAQFDLAVAKRMWSKEKLDAIFA